MLNRIIRFALDNRVTTLIITGILLLWGCYAMLRNDVDIFPDLNAPTVVVMTEASGLAPEEVEKTVTYPIETALNGASGVRRVRSSSATGFSVVWVEFDWNVSTDKARRIVSERLMTVAEKLPENVGAPTLGPESSILGEMMIIGLTSSDSTATDMMTLRSIADRTIMPRLLALGGVSQVSVLGGDVAEYQIKLIPERMQAMNVSLDEVRNAASNLNNNAPGGIIYDYGNEYIVKADIHTTSVDQIGNSLIRSDERGQVKINDIATVEISPSSPRLGCASVKGQPAVLITVTKQNAVSTVKLTAEIDKTLAQLRPTLPKDVKISTDIFRQSEFINQSISNLQVSLFEGAIFVIIVLFFFLMNARTTLISLVALPLSIIVTVIILDAFHLTINTMSLGGIAIAIGSLVDDTIVDVENVYKRIRQNRLLPPDKQLPVIKIIYNASCEVRLPILNSTLIIIVSFLPLFFLTGIEGRMLAPLGISFIVSLIASTIVALTVTPVLCSYLLAGKKASAKTMGDPKLTRIMLAGYEKCLAKVLRHGRAVLIATGVAFAAALALLPFLGRSFLPPFNEGSMTINISAMPGISLEQSDKIGRLAESIILSVPEVTTVARKTGRAELDEHSLGVNVSEIEAPFRLKNRSRKEMVAELRHKLSEIPGVNIEIGQPISHRIDAMLSGTEAQIAIKLFGDNLEQLYNTASQIKSTIKDIPGIVDVNVEQQTGRPQLDIRPRRDMMARYGITNEAFNTFVSTMLGGETVSQVYDKGYPYDVVLKVDENARKSIADVPHLLIDSNSGKIPLSYVADIVSTDGPNTINRENVSRRIVVSANVDNGDLRGAVNKIKENIDKKIKLPEGYYIEYGGQFESEANASRTLALSSLGAILVIFLILMHEYRNMGQSLIILVNMPLALIGGIFILVITRGELNIPAIIGFISLMGVATRNGMLLMSRYNNLEHDHSPLHERIIAGSRDRLTPIIMTALTSSLALIPLALRSAEPGNEIQSPMALVILGGLLTSTFLNIFVVPILYGISQKKHEKNNTDSNTNPAGISHPGSDNITN